MMTCHSTYRPAARRSRRESARTGLRHRLTDITLVDNNHWTSCSQEISYDGKGNTLSRTDVGQYGYSTSLPYAMSELSSPAASVPLRDQYLHYNAMQLPDTIIENCDTATFTYYGDMSRAAMTVTGPSGYRYSCDYYDQQYNEFSKTQGNTTSYKSVLWLGGSPYTAPAALLKDYGENTWQVVHVLRDNLGSITHVIDTTGVVLQEMSYTAWGQLRNPQNGMVYGSDAQPELLLGRGYTGHEHLPWFGLINMNARLYDPAVGRFLSPDPLVQAPDNTQNYNRYSYCLNNPLRYVDPLGLELEYHLFRVKLGELIYTCQLDEVVAIGYRNHVINYPVSRFFNGEISLNFFDNNHYLAEKRGNSFDGDGVSGSGGYATQLSAHNKPQVSSFSNEPTNLSKCLETTSFGLSSFSALTENSKATYVFGKNNDLYELRISKAGNDWIYGKRSHSVAKLSKRLSLLSTVLDVGVIFCDLTDAYDNFNNNNFEKGLECGVDAVVGMICIPFGTKGFVFDVLWELGLKDVFWKVIYYNRDNVILPQYHNGTLGLPSTLPFK